MKNLVLILGMFFMTQIQAQLLPPWPIHTNMVDRLSERHYREIKKDHQKMTELNTEHWLAVEGVTQAIIEKHDRLFIVGSPLISARPAIESYLASLVNTNSYYSWKYPRASLYNPYPSNMFKNEAIRYRYSSRINTERENIRYYLGVRKTGVSHELRIPEGERVLLTLQALGKIIQITLENAEY
jgi:hypothetical protein